MKNAKVSIIIPAYNEQHVIGDCLQSLMRQTYKLLEIIVVDDGSTDNTIRIVKNCQLSTVNCQLLHQSHLGPGHARNLGAKSAKGKVLVFVDADMTFDENFINDLTKPIMLGQTIGTFSKNEMNANSDNVWSRCWNLNRTGSVEKLVPQDSSDSSPVFRAILKKEFMKVGGFTSNGEYTDDWSLSDKLKQKATLAPGAIYYHSNPATLNDVWEQAQWFSTNKFISGSTLRKIKSLMFYSFPISITIGLFKSVIFKHVPFLLFRIWFDLAVFSALIKSFFTSAKYK